jgi:hypothetical protein
VIVIEPPAGVLERLLNLVVHYEVTSCAGAENIAPAYDFGTLPIKSGTFTGSATDHFGPGDYGTVQITGTFFGRVAFLARPLRARLLGRRREAFGIVAGREARYVLRRHLAYYYDALVRSSGTRLRGFRVACPDTQPAAGGEVVGGACPPTRVDRACYAAAATVSSGAQSANASTSCLR